MYVQGTREKLRISLPMTTLATLFLPQLHGGDGHALVDSLEHVVHGQRGSHGGRHSFHLDSGAALAVDSSCDAHGTMAAAATVVVVRSQELHVDFDAREADSRVAKRDDVGGALGGHDPGDAGDAEHVAFVGGLAFAQEVPRPGVGEEHVAAGSGLAGGDLFVVDLGHVDGLRGGEMGEIGVGSRWQSFLGSFLGGGLLAGSFLVDWGRSTMVETHLG